MSHPVCVEGLGKYINGIFAYEVSSEDIQDCLKQKSVILNLYSIKGG